VHIDAVVGVGTWRAIDGDDHGKNWQNRRSGGIKRVT